MSSLYDHPTGPFEIPDDIPRTWPIRLLWTLAVLAWRERPPLHLTCRVLDHAFVEGLCRRRRCGVKVSLVRDYRTVWTGEAHGYGGPIAH